MVTTIDRLLSRDDLRDLGIPYTKSYLRKLVQRGKFPRPVRLSERCVAWPETEIADWIAERGRGREASTKDMRRLRIVGVRGAATVRRKAAQRRRRKQRRSQ
jgi:prophage regulatory protein